MQGKTFQRSVRRQGQGCDGCQKALSDLPAGTRLRICNGCKDARYCSKACQNKDWKYGNPSSGPHRTGCKERVSEQHTHMGADAAGITLMAQYQTWEDTAGPLLASVAYKYMPEDALVAAFANPTEPTHLLVSELKLSEDGKRFDFTEPICLPWSDNALFEPPCTFKRADILKNFRGMSELVNGPPLTFLCVTVINPLRTDGNFMRFLPCAYGQASVLKSARMLPVDTDVMQFLNNVRV